VLLEDPGDSPVVVMRPAYGHRRWSIPEDGAVDEAAGALD